MCSTQYERSWKSGGKGSPLLFQKRISYKKTCLLNVVEMSWGRKSTTRSNEKPLDVPAGNATRSRWRTELQRCEIRRRWGGGGLYPKVRSWTCQYYRDDPADEWWLKKMLGAGERLSLLTGLFCVMCQSTSHSLVLFFNVRSICCSDLRRQSSINAISNHRCSRRDYQEPVAMAEGSKHHHTNFECPEFYMY